MTGERAENRLWQDRLLLTLFFLAPLLALHKALAMAPLLALLAAGLLAAPGWTLSRRRIADAAWRTWWPLALVLFSLLGWCLAASFWSFDPLFSLKSVAMLAGGSLAGLVFLLRLWQAAPELRRRALAWLAGGMAIAALLMTLAGIVERGGLADIGRRLWNMDGAATVFALMVWPVSAALVEDGRRARAFGLLLLVAAGIFLSHDLAAKVALLIAGLTLLATRLAGRPVVLAITLLAAAGSLAAPFAASHLPPAQESAGWSWLPTSAHHRLTIWNFVAARIADKPLLGWGFDSARAIPGGKQALPVVRLKGCPGIGDMVPVPGYETLAPADCVVWEERLPLHPHDAWLQIRLELGWPGALLAAGLILLLGARLKDPVAAAVFVAALIVLSVSYGVWQSWWLSSLWLAAGILVPARRSDHPLRLPS